MYFLRSLKITSLFFQLEVVYNHEYKLHFDYRRFLYNRSLLSNLSVIIRILVRKVAISPVRCRLQDTLEQPF